jgi:hypothetical protein
VILDCIFASAAMYEWVELYHHMILIRAINSGLFTLSLGCLCDGTAMLLCQYSVGTATVKRVAKWSFIWGVLFGGLTAAGNWYGWPTILLGVWFAIEMFRMVAYLWAWRAPAYRFYRRPAMLPFARWMVITNCVVNSTSSQFITY